MRTGWYVALAIVAVFFIVRSGGLAALQPLLKFLLPVAVVYWLVARIRKKLLPFKRAFEQMQARSYPGETEGPTIQICPKCGHQKDGRGGCKC